MRVFPSSVPCLFTFFLQTKLIVRKLSGLMYPGRTLKDLMVVIFYFLLHELLFDQDFSEMDESRGVII